MRRRSVELLLGLLLCNALLGCQVSSQPVSLSNYSNIHADQIFVVDRDIDFRLDTLYTKHIQENSEWYVVGAIPQGTVYKSSNGVFSVQGTNVHEAYLVVDQDQLVGFYLPAERAFSGLSSRVHLILKPKGTL